MCKTHSTIPVTIARGIHLFPFRTQKLSLLAPNVLGWKRPGRIGRCRFPNKKASERNKQVTNLTGARFFVCLEGKTRSAPLLFSPLSAASCARARYALPRKFTSFRPHSRDKSHSFGKCARRILEVTLSKSVVLPRLILSKNRKGKGSTAYRCSGLSDFCLFEGTPRHSKTT